MRHVSRVLLLTMAASVACAGGLASAAEQAILGKSLAVKDPKPGIDPSKRSIAASGKEKGSPETLVGDPTLAGSTGGALLEVLAFGATSSNQVFVLPQGANAKGKAFWTATGTTGFKYRDSKGEQGPVKAVNVKRSASGVFSIKVKVTGKTGQVDVLPPNPGTSGCVALKLGQAPGAGDRYSMQFGPESTLSNKGAAAFKASKPTAQGVCPGDEPTPRMPLLPAATQPCPTIADGSVTFLGKSVRVWVGPAAATQDGPLVFVWHWLGGTPSQATAVLLGGGQLADILAQGGMVAGIPATGAAFTAADFDVADEVVACAREQVGIDPFRIHSIGMSLGGLQTTAMSTARSNYVASVVAYSGGGFGAAQDPENKVPALVVHGGPSDQVVVNFKVLSEAYVAEMTNRGHFTILCDHGGGHTVPAAINGALDWQFLQDHPYGTAPSPYAGGLLPAAYPAYCVASD